MDAPLSDPERWRQHIPPKHQNELIMLCGVNTKKTIKATCHMVHYVMDILWCHHPVMLVN